jgi:hypothetical protein
MTLSLKGFYVTLSISDSQHNNTAIMFSVVIRVSHVIFYYVKCRYAECCGAVLIG